MLKFIALSGTVSVTENLYVYESQGKMMIVDCGVGFPDIDMHGVDLVIPDFSYVIENKDKLAGIVISQGHEDHLGAVPFLLRQVRTQIWAAPLVSEFLKDKLDEFGIKDYKINTFNPDNSVFDVGPFKVTPFRVTHSVPDTCGFAIDTPEGRVFHIPEHKMDQHPVDKMPFDTEKVKKLASEKQALFLASDCIGINKPGFAPPETEVEANIEKIAANAKGSLFMTAISSNIGRFQQMMNVASHLGRSVVLVGRSVQKKIEIAYNLGYINFSPEMVVSFRDIKKLKRQDLCYIVSGCYGQVGSSLHRIAIGEHEKVQVTEGDTMIFSADPAPPYSKESEDFVIDQLTDKGVDVHYYELNEGVYAGGHGRREDIKALFEIVRPKYFIPIGGEIRYMKAYKELAVEFGADPHNVFRLKPGDNIFFENGGAHQGERIPTKQVLVHGLGVGDVGKVVLGDRSVLGSEGVVVVVFKLDKNKNMIGIPTIVSRGFVFEKLNKQILDDAADRLQKRLGKGKADTRSIHDISADFLKNFFFQKTGRRPMILPVIINI
jgi:ribonuclease J